MKNPTPKPTKKAISELDGEEMPALIPINTPAHPFTVVAIGASAGGLEAITQLLQNLSPTTGMAFYLCAASQLRP